MQSTLGDILGENFERFLRWVYPGVLALSLLHLGRVQETGPDRTAPGNLVQTLGLSGQGDAVQLLGIGMAIIFLSFLLYFLQRYVVHEMIVHYLLFVFGKGDAYGYGNAHAKVKDRDDKSNLHRSPKQFWHWNTMLQLDYGSVLGGRYSANRDYGWSVTHAIGLSSWTILLAGFLHRDGSTLDNLSVVSFTVGSVFACAWIWQELKNILPEVWSNPLRF